MLNRVQIWRIGGPVCGIYTLLLELFLDFLCSIDWGIILHENKTCVVLGNIYVEYFDIGVGGVSLFLGLEVAVYYV
jgi:hypothetical protein